MSKPVEYFLAQTCENVMTILEQACTHIYQASRPASDNYA